MTTLSPTETENKPRTTGPEKGTPSPLARGGGPVKALRDRLHLTQLGLAQQSGLSRDVIQRCEAEGVEPKSRLAKSVWDNYVKRATAKN